MRSIMLLQGARSHCTHHVAIHARIMCMDAATASIMFFLACFSARKEKHHVFLSIM